MRDWGKSKRDLRWRDRTGVFRGDDFPLGVCGGSYLVIWARCSRQFENIGVKRGYGVVLRVGEGVVGERDWGVKG